MNSQTTISKMIVLNIIINTKNTELKLPSFLSPHRKTLLLQHCLFLDVRCCSLKYCVD